MSIKANYPDIRPTLNLDFANTKRLDPRITFTRTTTGTYVGSDGLIKTAAIDEARFDHDPATGESLGLLIEESRTNLMYWSEAFDETVWPNSNSSVSSNSHVAPDGTTTGDTLTVSASDGNITQFKSVTNSSVYSFSVFVKKIDSDTVRISFSNVASGPIFTFSSESFTTVPSGWTAEFEKFDNGWYRLKATRTSTTTYAGFQIVVATSGESVAVWGAQMEEASFPTSYIPTSGSTVTRSADVASIATSAFGFNRPQGTLFAQYQLIGLDGTTPVVYGDNANGRFIYHVAGSIRAFDGTTIEAVSTNVQSDTQANKVAMFFDESEFGLSVLGSAIEKSNYDGTGFDDASQLDLTSGGNYHMKKLQYYPLRLSNTVLQGLTS